jgi:hypothetical protein
MINKNRRIIRTGILFLFIIAMLGPWAYDLINVPAQYTCQPPNVRLYGDFCGVPLSGAFIFLLIPSFFLSVWELLTSTLPYYGRLVSGLSILLLFPFFTTMFSLWKKETHRLRMTNLTAWILAFILTLSLFILQINRQAIQLWGLWLYILTTISAIIFEFGVQRWELSREHKA